MNGTNGTNGTNGKPGPSDVYGWAGGLSQLSPGSDTLTVPAGSYVVRWQGWLESATAVRVLCYLELDGIGSGENFALAAGQATFASYEVLVRAKSAFTTDIACAGFTGILGDDVVLTATATGNLSAPTAVELP